ncbi:unnamed protein product [Kuraishia capsulata CBS 1993]|uniref:Transcription regulator LGE1 helical region domain-containing protein n=1 Tax=Kuraishia capsulata CBS 1993 TaxID=1382522 RepID=W6MUI9_9ASCO|nr:uncharacterized protein KUCA_T00001635001 [Kuraishia capsulata CBS 1993]CDK25665.1 unnamed protein product [Kuraishia capsulata CBS 1993]
MSGQSYRGRYQDSRGERGGYDSHYSSRGRGGYWRGSDRQRGGGYRGRYDDDRGDRGDRGYDDYQDDYRQGNPAPRGPSYRNGGYRSGPGYQSENRDARDNRDSYNSSWRNEQHSNYRSPRSYREESSNHHRASDSRASPHSFNGGPGSVLEKAEPKEEPKVEFHHWVVRLDVLPDDAKKKLNDALTECDLKTEQLLKLLKKKDEIEQKLEASKRQCHVEGLRAQLTQEKLEALNYL